MSPTPDLTPDELITEARRRAETLRESGELPDDIDDRLSDDYARSVQRNTERAPVDPRATIEVLRSKKGRGMSPGAPQGAPAAPRTLRGFAGRIRRKLSRGPMSSTELLRDQVATTLELMASETERLGRLADNAVASSDMLASRVTVLERKLAIEGRTDPSTELPDENRT